MGLTSDQIAILAAIAAGLAVMYSVVDYFWRRRREQWIELRGQALHEVVTGTSKLARDARVLWTKTLATQKRWQDGKNLPGEAELLRPQTVKLEESWAELEASLDILGFYFKDHGFDPLLARLSKHMERFITSSKANQFLVDHTPFTRLVKGPDIGSVAAYKNARDSILELARAISFLDRPMARRWEEWRGRPVVMTDKQWGDQPFANPPSLEEE